MDKIRDIHDLNARLWAWLEECYHRGPHGGLDGMTPLDRYRQDLVRVRPLGAFAAKLDELFLHRHDRQVKKDGTVSYEGGRFEVPFELVGQTVKLVVDPHQQKVLGVESQTGEPLGKATPLDLIANSRRKRRSVATEVTYVRNATGANMVELALETQRRRLCGEMPEEEV